MEKTKEAGKVNNSLKITANAVQFLNGEECSRNAKVPCILLNYQSPESAKAFAKGERFALWFKLEEAEWRRMEQQLNKNLRELTIWFDEHNLNQLKEFLNGR